MATYKSINIIKFYAERKKKWNFSDEEQELLSEYPADNNGSKIGSY